MGSRATACATAPPTARALPHNTAPSDPERGTRARNRHARRAAARAARRRAGPCDGCRRAAEHSQAAAPAPRDAADLAIATFDGQVQLAPGGQPLSVRRATAAAGARHQFA